MIESTRIKSRTARAKGPTTSRVCDSGTTPFVEYLPLEVLSPTIPHKAAGIRTEPPVSVPRPTEHKRPARGRSAAAATTGDQAKIVGIVNRAECRIVAGDAK